MSGTVADFVAEQPAVARAVLGAAGPAVEGLRPAGRVLLVGSGTSYHASRLALPAFPGARAAVPSDVLHEDGHGTGPDTLVVGVSQSGRSTGTLEVLRRAHGRGARTVLVTGEDGGAATGFADLVLDVGCGPEPVGAKTKGFTATALTLTRLGHALSGSTAGAGEEIADQLATLLDTAREPVGRLVAGRAPSAVHIVTWGAWRPVADEGALKILETSLLPVEVWDVEEFLHGPHRRLSAGSLLVVVGDQDPRGERADALVRFVLSLGARVLDLRTGVTPGSGPHHEVITLPAPVLPAVVPLQLLALELTAAAGHTPEDDPQPGFHSLLDSKLP